MVARSVDEADVTRVQIPHGGNEGDTSPFATPTAHLRANRSNLSHYIHLASLLNTATSQGVVVEPAALHALDRGE
jgi:hypothetical protein